ncbi:MAG: NAD(+)/NADH kinase [Puniceicoccales bacterium]|jgi:NAD+ kinase|nr:NAD(+)/NADH kinase [Puniceicoccales bacterium]
MKSASIKSVAIVVNSHKYAASGTTESVAKYFEGMKIAVRIGESGKIDGNFFSSIGLCITVGGDGTLLHLASDAAEKNVPLIGINCGHLGFLTALNRSNWAAVLPSMLEGKRHELQEHLLQCSYGNANYYALNDFVIKNRNSSRLFDVQVFVDDHLLNNYHSDGVIIATPLGSTAYNLSAGGAIVAPMVSAISISPICPHSLSNRSIILPDSSRIKIQCTRAETHANLYADGHDLPDPMEQECIFICRARRRVTIWQPENYSYYAVLRDKLSWK